MSGASLLVVDDDPDLLKLLSMRLRAAGYQVAAVSTAEQALARVLMVRVAAARRVVRHRG